MNFLEQKLIDLIPKMDYLHSRDKKDEYFGYDPRDLELLDESIVKKILETEAEEKMKKIENQNIEKIKKMKIQKKRINNNNRYIAIRERLRKKLLISNGIN